MRYWLLLHCDQPRGASSCRIPSGSSQNRRRYWSGLPGYPGLGLGRSTTETGLEWLQQHLQEHYIIQLIYWFVKYWLIKLAQRGSVNRENWMCALLPSAVEDQRLWNHSVRSDLSLECKVSGLRGGEHRSDADSTTWALEDGRSRTQEREKYILKNIPNQGGQLTEECPVSKAERLMDRLLHLQGCELQNHKPKGPEPTFFILPAGVEGLEHKF